MHCNQLSRWHIQARACAYLEMLQSGESGGDVNEVGVIDVRDVHQIEPLKLSQLSYHFHGNLCRHLHSWQCVSHLDNANLVSFLLK